MAYEEDSAKRKKREPFLKRKEKEIEEEKRLFYVAVTRAQDFLCMIGAWEKKEKASGRLAYLIDTLGVIKDGKINPEVNVLEIMNESRIDEIYSGCHPSLIRHQKPLEPFMSEPIYTEPISYEPSFKWRNVTEEIDIKVKHGEDWVLLGKVFHKLFEELSKGLIGIGDIDKRASILLRAEVYRKEQLEKMIKLIKGDFEKLSISGYLKDVISPSINSYVELPFILQKGKTIFRGRIDRVIMKDNSAHIYDYKTFPTEEKELTGLIDKYRFQMDIYREAVEKIFNLRTKSYLLFTHKPLLVEM
jgi:ATP-dependent exoDNAse (exonuclease V) beta subunit